VRGITADAYNPGHRAATIDASVAHDGVPDESTGGRAWLGGWVHASRDMLAVTAAPASDSNGRAGAFAREQLALFREPVTRRMLVEAVWRVTWPHDRLVLGASRLIREADTYVAGKHVPVHANRGLAGIDGTIATAIGIALSSQDAEGGSSSGITRVLVGDLTALHDVGALLFGGGEVRPRIQVVVGNDGGGTIFDGLDVAATAPTDFFDRVQYTPQSVDLRALATAYGWEYRVARNRGELDEALATSGTPTLVEVPLSR
jgi:2-succinyl-5-enolpyruvyl-6-hydroxy-3-cyclohexene-1-carboxylate synthase